MQTWSAALSTSRPFGAVIGSGHSLSKSANWWEVNSKPGRDGSLASRVEVTVVLIQGAGAACLCSDQRKITVATSYWSVASSMRDDQDHLGTKEHLVKGDPQATTFQVVGV
jgi:hypothetical protein